MPDDKTTLFPYPGWSSTPSEEELLMERWAKPVPYVLPEFYDGNGISGVANISDGIKAGWSGLYSSDIARGAKFYQDRNGEIYRIADDATVNTDGLREVSYADIRKMLPGKDYIGGSKWDVRIEAMRRMPRVAEKVYERAKAYGIDPNMMIHRLMDEGWVDQQVTNYNNTDASEQGNYWDIIWDQPVSGYGSFGLDYAGDNLMAGKYSLLDENARWTDLGTWEDLEGATGYRHGEHQVEAENLASAIEMMAADMKYRQDLVRQRYEPSAEDLGKYVNAAYHRGVHGRGLDNVNFVRSEYSYPDYYGEYGFSKGRATNDKLVSLVERLSSGGYGIEYSEGGSIHIKPSHRGRLTELKARTGKTEAELYNDGNPAHKKMVVFARNSRKWKHGDGGFLNQFEAGGDKDNDALGKAIAERVRREQEAKARAEGAPMMGEKPLVSEDYLLGAAALASVAPISGTVAAMKEAAPFWGKAGLHMLRDIPAFEFTDRLPTLFGGKRMTELGGDATQAAYEGITGNHNLSDMSRALVRMPGEFIAGVVPGVAGDVLMRTGSNAVLRSLNNRGIRIDGSMDYLEPLAYETNVATAMPKSTTAKMPIVSTVDANAYEIADLGGGYMIKSLMRGNPLEKQISKNGTVNVNNIRALINKGSKAEQAVVDKVFASEEFAGKRAIDYNKFRKAVQDELITYDRTPDTRYEDYGMERLGYKTNKNVYAPEVAFIDKHQNWSYNYDDNGNLIWYYRDKPASDEQIEKVVKPWIEKYNKSDKRLGPKSQSFTFSSPRIPGGSAKHYNENTLGHSRTYTTADEPDVLHVMESQSDWAQSPQKMRRAALDSYSGLNGTDWLTLYSDAQANYLADNYTSRQIQENLRYAAEKGQKKMRYPTRETVAKIEGYSKSRSQALADNPKLQEKYDDLRSELAKSEGEIYKKYVPDGYIDPSMRDVDYGDFGIRMSDEDIQIRLAQERASEAFDKTPEHKKMVDEIIAVREKINPDRWLEENVPEVYLKEHETILKKYDAFPKQYQKLFKGADVRIVTDAKGNTWYEVDVPENYLQQEWAYADGGHLSRVTQGSIIQRYGKDKILSAISKMKQPK